MIRDGERGIELRTILQRKADIRHDENVGIHRTRDVDGQVLGQTAVDQQAALIIHRCEHAGCRNAGAHGDGQVPFVQEYGAAAFQIRSDRAKRRRQPVEIRSVVERQRQLAQRLLQFLALDQPLRQQDLAVLQTQRQAHQEVTIVLLAPEREIAPRRRVAKSLLPVDRAHGFVDVVRTHAAGIQTADHGAHAGARDAIDGYLELFENFEHADVRHAARAAAGEHQADTGADRIGRAGGGPIRPRIVSAGAGRPRIRRQRQP